MSFGEGIKAFNWVTDRIDQISKFFTKKGRENEINKINDAVDTGDNKSIGNIVSGIKVNRDKRKDF